MPDSSFIPPLHIHSESAATETNAGEPNTPHERRFERETHLSPLMTGTNISPISKTTTIFSNQASSMVGSTGSRRTSVTSAPPLTPHSAASNGEQSDDEELIDALMEWVGSDWGSSQEISGNSMNSSGKSGDEASVDREELIDAFIEWVDGDWSSSLAS
ncbi:hypothetical protein M231_04857 [Tremella mesenterica]|uniref:Uncharacterized protein n=1 Tax=Tremella mesenterica TaxID=5217 RepID=A0A4Q1BJH4_TREME|nr:hypothetical protein M231_04857 [Tremella mesenterica]